jgi:PHD/YefM family antitoxin component YafN of YafNO toxin-antitoxin module
MDPMTTVSASVFEKDVRFYADSARSRPARVVRRGGEDIVLLSAEAYARLRSTYREVITLDDITRGDALELLEALTNAPATPPAQAVDNLMEATPLAALRDARARTGAGIRRQPTND